MQEEPPDILKPGSRVMYSPSNGVWFEGTVASKPWQLGDGTWVAKLTDMEEAYGLFMHKRGDKATNVYAASIYSIRSCDPFAATGEV